MSTGRMTKPGEDSYTDLGLEGRVVAFVIGSSRPIGRARDCRTRGGLSCGGITGARITCDGITSDGLTTSAVTTPTLT